MYYFIPILYHLFQYCPINRHSYHDSRNITGPVFNKMLMFIPDLTLALLRSSFHLKSTFVNGGTCPAVFVLVNIELARPHLDRRLYDNDEHVTLERLAICITTGLRANMELSLHHIEHCSTLSLDSSLCPVCLHSAHLPFHLSILPIIGVDMTGCR